MQYPNIFSSCLGNLRTFDNVWHSTNIFLCFQPVYWCENNIDDMASHLGEADDETEFQLDDADANSLRAFVMSSGFSPFLEALDPNTARVEARRKSVQSVATFKDYTRDRAARELHRWMAPLDDRVEGK